MYQIEKIVSSSHIDFNGELTLSAAVDFMQDCSYFQIRSVPSLVKKFDEKEMAMFVVSRQLDVLEMPVFGEKLTVRTWVWSLNKVFGSRNTVIYDGAGRERVVSYAMGSFVDLKSGRPTKICENVLQDILIEEKLDMEYLPRKIALPDIDFQEMPPQRVLRSYLDHFNHVNNSKYIMLANDLFPLDLDIKRMRVEYKMPAQYGDVFHPEVCSVENKKIVLLNDNYKKPYAIVEFS